MCFIGGDCFATLAMTTSWGFAGSGNPQIILRPLNAAAHLRVASAEQGLLPLAAGCTCLLPLPTAASCWLLAATAYWYWYWLLLVSYCSPLIRFCSDSLPV